MARLFLAVWPPPSVVESLVALPRADTAGVRWTTPEQWHVTLRFFGEADTDDVLAACDGIDAPACRVTIGPTVERLGRGVVMVVVHGLGVMADVLTEATRSVGRPPEGRAFRGHITLARLGRARRCPLVGSAIEGAWTASAFTLVRSDLHPHGARYTTIATLPLR